MYQVFLIKSAAREGKKRGKKFKKVLEDILQKLKIDPLPPQTERLSGELYFIYSYHFNFSGTAFRMAYTIDQQVKKLTVVMVGPRENFYKTLKQRIR